MPQGYVQLRSEQTVGNESVSPTLSTKTLYVPADEFSVDQGASFLDRDDEMRGLSEQIPHFPETYSGKWSLKSRLYPDTLGMALSCMFGTSATGETGATHYTYTAGNGIITDPDGSTIPTSCSRHVWVAPFGPSGASPKTFQSIAAYKDQGLYFKSKGSAVEALSIDTPESGGAMIEASGGSAYMDAVSDPALSPSYETLATRPFMRAGQLVMTWLSGTATFADFGFQIGNPVDFVRSLGTASKHPDVVEKAEGLVTVGGSVDKRQLDIDDFNALRDATEFAAKVRWRSDTVIASSYQYAFWLEMTAAQYTDGNMAPLGNRRRLGGSFNFRAARNASPSVTLTLVNNVTSYS